MERRLETSTGKDRPEIGFLLQKASVSGQAVGFGSGQFLHYGVWEADGGGI